MPLSVLAALVLTRLVDMLASVPEAATLLTGDTSVVRPAALILMQNRSIATFLSVLHCPSPAPFADIRRCWFPCGVAAPHSPAGFASGHSSHLPPATGELTPSPHLVSTLTDMRASACFPMHVRPAPSQAVIKAASAPPHRSHGLRRCVLRPSALTITLVHLADFKCKCLPERTHLPLGTTAWVLSSGRSNTRLCT